MLQSFFQSPVSVLIVLNLLVFFFPYIIPVGGTGNSFHNFLYLGRKDNAAILNGEYYRLLTSIFLHADPIHLIFNLSSLWNVGPFVYYQFGLVGFLIIYFVSGLSSSLASFFFSPNPSIGASGAIFGLVGSIMAFAFLVGNSNLITQILVVLVVNFLYALNPSNQIDNFGHLGGFLSGFLLGLILLSK